MPKSSIKTLFTGTLGTLLEWAEYTFFAYMADELATHFFAIENPDIARLKTYGIFATSYFMRPLGAILFGAIGDKYGRKPALMGSMLLMCFATTAIGFLPTYTSIGVLAPLLLILCRLLQGIALGGEFNGAVVFMIEHTTHRPFLAGAFGPFAAALGMALGAFAATLVSMENAPHFAWRIPFWCSAMMGLLALYLRQSIAESPEFQKIAFATKKTSPLITTFQENRNAFFKTMMVSLFVAVYVHIGNVYYKITSIKIGLLSPLVASQIVTGGQLLTACWILLCGIMADRFNGKKMCLFGLGSAVFLGPVILTCGQSGDILFTALGQILYAFINGLVSAPMMTLLVKPFQAKNRYTGSSLGWSLSAALFGGTALMVAETLVSQYGLTNGPGVYISCTAVIAFLAVSGIPFRARNLLYSQ